MYIDAEFDVIVANVHHRDGSLVEWAVPYQTYTTANGSTVAVIAATAVYETFYNKLGWSIEEPREILRTLASELRQKVDCIVCLSHLGIHEDRQLAEETTDIDVILGAHTHHLFVEGEMENGTLLAATGKFGQYVGHVTITIEDGQVVDTTAEVLPATELPASSQEKELIRTLIQKGEDRLNEEVFTAPQSLKQDVFADSTLSDFFGQALVAYTNADCGLFNAGIFLGSLPQGIVTKRDLHNILPHPINACVLTVTGESLRTYYEASLDPEWARTEVRGLGFRGTIMGAMIHVNLTMKNGILHIGEHAVRLEKEYRLATLDMFTFGFFYPDMKCEKIDYIVPELIRDIVGWYGYKQYGTTLY